MSSLGPLLGFSSFARPAHRTGEYIQFLTQADVENGNADQRLSRNEIRSKVATANREASLYGQLARIFPGFQSRYYGQLAQRSLAQVEIGNRLTAFFDTFRMGNSGITSGNIQAISANDGNPNTVSLNDLRNAGNITGLI